MTPHRDLDSAIDVVAKHLTHVDDDPVLTARIVASLPERMTWFGWLATSWAPRLALLAIAAAASLLVMNREQKPEAVAALPSAPTTMIATALRPALNMEPLAPPSRTMPLEPVEPLEPLEPSQATERMVADHEFSLPALDVEALAPMNLPAVASIELAPLVIADLPLSGEFPEKY